MTYINNIIKYENINSNKLAIINCNINKIGIYRWINLTTNESYIGSSSNIGKRLRKYFCTSYLTHKTHVSNSKIYTSILKYGYSNFNIEILEYCELNNLIEREQYYFDLLKPNLNILKTAGSCLGFKHSLETLKKFKNRQNKTGFITITYNLSNNTNNEYKSIRLAAKELRVSHTTLLRYIKNQKILNNTYIITLKTNY